MKKKFLVLSILLLVSCGSGDNKEFLSNNQKSIDACLSKGGIPILGYRGKLEKCDFPPDICKQYLEKGRQ
jgi:hypothetical protein